MQALYHWFISKHRLVAFEVRITLHELINVPLVSGNFFVKWRTKSGTAASGCTERAPIADHRVEWNASALKRLDLVIGKDGVLAPCELQLCVKQEMNQETPRNLGVLTVNLAEYAREGRVTRRYLLQESKSNSTIKLTIDMKQVAGDTRYKTPALKKNQMATSLADLSSHPRSHRFKPRNRSIYEGSTGHGPRAYSISKSASSPFLPLGNGLASAYEEPAMDIMKEIFFPSAGSTLRTSVQ
ncbi:hypothetical protein IWQ60_002946 [Tieghemiomyces parasiticus]|uniref:C2 NT-type domain-containing protein n=1 Tax=Tieghemiomyces parasiticus TaxID=78921 RepID=A0A9W8E0J0_9FUNG|nr:hypothetical protein IWQ60_002946 [Tieghemiomyces parasiticus]